MKHNNKSYEILKIGKTYDMYRLPVILTVMHLDGEDCLQQSKYLNLMS